MPAKIVTIVDAFITNDEQEKSLKSFLSKIKGTGPIFLVSNSRINSDVLELVDYFFYDKHDNLFQYDYPEYEKFYHWRKIGGIKLITVEDHKQKHGLSVMTNLSRVLRICLDIGFTHFRRIEYDTFLGNETLRHFESMPNKCLDSEKSCYFFVNSRERSVMYQYFFSDIEFFINNFPDIRSESDYIELLRSHFGNENFVVVEKLMYHFLKKCDPDLVFSFESENEIIFSDSIWNNSTSATHFDDHYRDCYVNVYRNSDKFLCFSINNTFTEKYRRVVFIFQNGKKQEFEYRFNSNGHWFINDVYDSPIRMEIFDENSMIFSKDMGIILNHVE
jgi:hypothetical protein